jgi:GDPmannose 4,6-dehydratase
MMPSRTALIIGHTGQDGTLLSEYLRKNGYEVVGISRSSVDVPGISTPLDLTRSDRAAELILATRPAEVYYLAAFHHSAEESSQTDNDEVLRRSLDVHVLSLQRVLSAIQEYSPRTRLFYAASSHVFGPGAGKPFNEDSPLEPGCIYGLTKTAGTHLCRYYRNTHGLYVTVGFLFNHESSLRKPQFLSRKIASAAASIHATHTGRLALGNLDAQVDWGYAPDFVTAMQLALTLPTGEDFVIATGEQHTVAEFAEIAFSAAGLDWNDWVDVRPGTVVKQQPMRVGDARKLRRLTGWAPSVSFAEMVKLLVEGEIRRQPPSR